MSIEDRREAVQELTAEGESQRDIASVLGVDQSTIHRDLDSNDANASSDAPEIRENGENQHADDANASPEQTIEPEPTTANWITVDLSARASNGLLPRGSLCGRSPVQARP